MKCHSLSIDVKDLCEIGEAMNHPDVAQIKEQKELVVLKEICLKYRAEKMYAR